MTTTHTRLSDRPPTICILAVSAIADDPRVRRQAEAFHRLGWRVIAVGLPGARSEPPEWPILIGASRPSIAAPPHAASTQTPLPMPATPIPAAAVATPTASRPRRLARLRSHLRRGFWNFRRVVFVSEEQWRSLERRVKSAIGCVHARLASAHSRLLMLWVRVLRAQRAVRSAPLRQMMRWVREMTFAALRVERMAERVRRVRYRLRQASVRLRPWLAQELYQDWSPGIGEVQRTAQDVVQADVWLANDWNMLPAAAQLARDKGGVYGYDTHEFATEEYAEKLRWRLLQRPIVHAIERRFIAGAAVVSAVSAGIAERLDAMYRLPKPSLVIRNMPLYQECGFHPTTGPVRVLYHGIVAPGRGLEAAIDSVADWPADYELTIRGPENPGYSDMLRARIAERGLASRARLVPPVPMTDLVREAAPFDIGFFALPGHSRHNQFALPNKFFEYVMAGLALCVSDLPEMARLVEQYRLGVLIPRVDPMAIAAAISRLDRGSIDICKCNALAAARELCWERESRRMVDAYRPLVGAQAMAG